MKKKELEALKKEQRKLLKSRDEAENRIKATPKYQRLGKTVEQLRKKRGALQKERDKLRKKILEKFTNIGKTPYPYFLRNTNAFYGGDTNIHPRVLRAIGKVAPLSKLKASQIEETVNLLMLREETFTPKLAKVLVGITAVDNARSLAWDKQDELVRGVDTFSGKIVELSRRIEILEEEIKYPEMVKARNEKEATGKLVFNKIDEIYEALTKKKRRQ